MNRDPKKIFNEALKVQQSQEVTFKQAPKEKVRLAMQRAKRDHWQTLKQLETR